MPSEDEASCRAETRHAALIDIVVEITGHGKIISIISTKNHDMLLRFSETSKDIPFIKVLFIFDFPWLWLVDCPLSMKKVIRKSGYQVVDIRLLGNQAGMNINKADGAFLISWDPDILHPGLPVFRYPDFKI